MNCGIEQPLAPTLRALAITRILFDVGDQARIEDHLPRLLLDSRVVGFADVIQPNCCHPFLLEALLFQGPEKGVVLLGPCLEHKTPESKKSVLPICSASVRAGAPDPAEVSPSSSPPSWPTGRPGWW